MTQIDIRTNLPDFAAQLHALGSDFERRAVRSATAAAAVVFRKIAAQKAPVMHAETLRRGRIIGALKRNIITVRSRKKSLPGIEFYSDTVRASSKKIGGLPFYWTFLERGWIPRGPGKRFAGGNRSRALARSRAIKGGARFVSYKFMKPAFNEGKQRALDAFYARIEKKINDYNAKRWA